MAVESEKIVKFVIISNDAECPYEGAKREVIPRTESRYVLSAEEFDKLYGKTEGSWFSVGSNHRVGRDGYIIRDIGTRDVWTIAINSLEELMSFIAKYGAVVVDDCSFNNDDELPSIEIPEY